MLSVLVTGGNGFLGRSLYKKLQQMSQYQIKATIRKAREEIPDSVVIREIDAKTDWGMAITDMDVIIHTAARAHIIDETAIDPVVEFRTVNVEGTLNLAWQAAEAGIKRFIFISTIGVNGNINSDPFSENDVPNPAEPYAQSKLEAEQGLWDIQSETGMEVVIIRPPLVYGPNAPGNFSRLVRLVEKGWPLPFGLIHNKRSFVALDNLVDLIVTCINHPAAANEVFLAGDGEDLSTSDLLIGIARAMGKPSRLIPVPESCLRLGANLLGKNELADRLLGSLQVDISKARDILGWEPPFSIEEGLKRCFESENNV